MSEPHELSRYPTSTEKDKEEPKPEFPEANAAAVKALAGALATTLGPTPRDKLVIQNLATREEPGPNDVAVDDFVASSDGATLLEKFPIQHPIAPIVKRMVGPERPGDTDVEGQDIPDGVTTSIVLAASMLDEAIDLLDYGIHPSDIIRGYHEAQQVAADALSSIAQPLTDFDDPETAAHNVAITTMNGNDVGGYADMWARIACEAVDQVGFPTEKTLAVRQIRSGSIADSQLVRGAVLDRNSRASEAMPQRVDDASVLVLGGHERGGLRTPNVTEEFTVNVEDPDELNNFDDVFDDWRTDVFQKIVEADVDVVVTELGIDGSFLDRLAEHEIIGVRGVNRLDLAQVAMATGARIVKDPTDVSADATGYAGVIREEPIALTTDSRTQRRMIVFEECTDPESVCVLLRGVNEHIGHQATTMVRKAAASVAAASGNHGHQRGVVPGGGAVDEYLATVVREESTGDGTRASLAMEAFADALEQVPFILAKNAGADPIGTVADLRAANQAGPEQGFILPDGEICDAMEAGVLDAVALRDDSLQTATSVTNMLLRVDDTIDAEFTEEDSDPGEAIYDDVAERHADYLDEH